MTIQTQLEEAVAQAAADSDLLHQIVHGSSTSTVVTEGGPVRAIAKLIADKDEEINLASDGLLAQSTALATSASVSAAAAAASESAASASEQHALASETASQNSQMAAAMSESQAAVSATNAADSQAMTLAHQMAAASSESAAANSEANALAYQTAAQASQQAAATSESNAAASAVSAASSAASAAASLDNFDDRYLGPKPEDPYVDNDGNALLTGALYFNTDPFQALLAALNGSRASVMAPAVINIAGIQEDSARHFPTLRQLTTKLLGGPNGRYILQRTQGPTPVDWVAGMFMLFPAEDFKAIGGFDEKFFLYYEDVDICTRLWKAGRPVMVCPQVQVVHDAQRASRKNWQFMKWHAASMARYFWKHWGRFPRKSVS